MHLSLAKRRSVSILIFLTLTLGLKSQAYFDYHQEIETAYNHVLQLKTDSASLILDRIKRDEPNNLATLHIENYIDFFRVFLGEEKADLEQFRKKKDQRLTQITRHNLSSPYYKFAQAEIILQYALARSKFGEYIRAGWDINRANKLLSKNQKLYPEFLLNNKSLSIIHALMGSLKGIRKSLIRIFTSLDGNYAQGIHEIEQLFQASGDEHDIFGAEIRAVRALISLHVEKKPAEALEIIDIDAVAHMNSPLLDFVRYTIAKQNQDKLKDLIPYLEDALSHHSDSPFQYLNLLLGIELLQKGDPKAQSHLLTFITEFKGRHYFKEAYQKLAWYELIINDNEDGYVEWMQKLIHVGHTSIGEDQLAQKEALSREIPNKSILLARLLYDGGNYEEALTTLEKVQRATLNENQQIEYYYRYGRCLQGLGKYDEALNIYKQVISLGSKFPTYYACSSALQSGIIHFNLGNSQEAQHMLQRCLDLKPDEHRESLHQKAQSWLQKIKGH